MPTLTKCEHRPEECPRFKYRYQKAIDLDLRMGDRSCWAEIYSWSVEPDYGVMLFELDGGGRRCKNEKGGCWCGKFQPTKAVANKRV